MFGTGHDNEFGTTQQTVELSAFFESDGAGTGNLAADLTIDHDAVGGDELEKFDTGAFFHAQFSAGERAGNPAVSADDNVARALDIGGKSAEHGEMVAAHGDATERSSFANDHIAARFNAGVGMLDDLVVGQADVAAAFRALARLGFRDGIEGLVAAETNDFARWFRGLKQAHPPRTRWWCAGAEALRNLRLDGLCRRGLWLATEAGLGEPRDRNGASDAFAILDLEIASANAALSGNHQCWFRLQVSAFWASHLDAMALELIGHGCRRDDSERDPSTLEIGSREQRSLFWCFRRLGGGVSDCGSETRGSYASRLRGS